MLQPREYVSSLGKTVRLLLGSLAFVAIAVFVPHDGTGSRWRIWCGGFFGLCALVGVWLLIRPQRLSVNHEGFTLSGGFVLTPKTIPWREVQGFFVYRLPRGGRMVGFNFEPDAPSRTKLGNFNRRFGAEGALPKLWAESPERLAEELNLYRDEALGRGSFWRS